MFRTWLAEGTTPLLTMGVPAVLAALVAATLMLCIRLTLSATRVR